MASDAMQTLLTKSETTVEVKPEGRTSRLLTLSEKALLTLSEEAERKQILSDSKLLTSIEKALLSVTPEQFMKENQRRRFEQIAYLEKALAWRENPARENIIQEGLKNGNRKDQETPHTGSSGSAKRCASSLGCVAQSGE